MVALQKAIFGARRQSEAATALRLSWPPPFGERSQSGTLESKAPSPLRSAGALQIKSPNHFSLRDDGSGSSSLWMFLAFSR